MGIAIIVPGVSFADANLGKVTLQGNVPVTGLDISGPSTVSGSTNAAKYLPVVTPAATTQRGITWSVTSGSSYASINSSTGILTVLSGASSSSVTICATSSANPSITGEKTITVTYDESQHATPNYYYSKNYPSQSDTVEDILYSNVSTDDCIVAISYDLSSYGSGAFIFTMNTGSSPYQGVTLGWNRSSGPMDTLELTNRVNNTSAGWTALTTLDNESGKIAVKTYRKDGSNGLFLKYTTDGVNWSSEVTIYDLGSSASCGCGYRIAVDIYIGVV